MRCCPGVSLCSNRATQTTLIRARRQPNRLKEEPHDRHPIPPGVRRPADACQPRRHGPEQDIVVDGQGEVPTSSTSATSSPAAASTCAGAPTTGPRRRQLVKAGELPVGCQCDKDVRGRRHLRLPPPAASPAPCRSRAAAAPAAAGQLRLQREPLRRQHLRLQQGRARPAPPGPPSTRP